MQLTEVSFVDENNGFAVGEFGTVLRSSDGGANWDRLNDIPNEFYPMAAAFRDLQHGWVGGLDGVIWHTADGGQTWKRELSISKSPIYRIVAAKNGRTFAVGGAATLIEYGADGWQAYEGAPPVLAYLRALDVLDNGDLLIAGGGGTLAKVSVGDDSVALSMAPTLATGGSK